MGGKNKKKDHCGVEWKMKLNLSNGKTDKGVAVISFVIIFLSLTALLVIFEMIFFTLLYRMWYAGKHELWALQSIAVMGYVGMLYLTGHSKIMRVVYFLFSLVVSGVVLGAILLFNGLWTLKAILGSSLGFSILGLVISFRSKGAVFDTVKVKSIGLILFISLGCVISASLLLYLPKSVTIKPVSEPELIFWCGTKQLPTDEVDLEMCQKYGISFAATIRKSDVNNTDYMHHYKTILNHSINLRLCIGNDEFFTHIGNAHELPDIYRAIRNWFEDEGILDNEYLHGFCVDAETPQYYIEVIETMGQTDTYNYLVDNFPTPEEIEENEKGLQDFVKMVRNDGKKAGIVRLGHILDSSDQDGDMSLLFRNIYSLDVKWDYSVMMLYRTQRYAGLEEGQSPTEKLLTFFYENFFGIFTQGSVTTTSLHSFYQNVAMAQQPSIVDVDPDNQYIFIGNFDREFEDTDYIKNKEWKEDLDVCRHFYEEEVWFYILGGFKYHYGGWDSLREVGRHNKQHREWTMDYTSEDNIKMLLNYGTVMFLDMMVNYEEDLL